MREMLAIQGKEGANALILSIRSENALLGSETPLTGAAMP